VFSAEIPEMLETGSLHLLEDSLATLEKGFESLPSFFADADTGRMKEVLEEVARRMQDNFPYPHPLYAGQMLKPPHAIARLAYALSLWINPNNHALDGGRASSAMEKEAVAAIAAMLGFKNHLGHLCSGGTMANLEALWVAGNVCSDRLIVASQQAHYTHERLCQVLRLPFAAIPADGLGRMSLDSLRRVLDEGNVGCVVVTTGTTATGSLDPLPEILELRSKYGFRIHVDAAYGGYFRLAANLNSHALEVLSALEQADSLVIDPHKHGLQPYGCGCVLFADPSVGCFYRHDSPYTYFTSSDLHLGEISLECSRPGAAAVALWATQQLLPMIPGGEFALALEKSREAACELYRKLSSDPRFIVPFEPELDIVVYAPKAGSASKISDLSRRIFEKAAKQGLHLALANLPKGFFSSQSFKVEWDQEHVTCLRSCLMKPEHRDWLDEILAILDKAISEAFTDGH
jgi:tyrosine decarboxylase / aspartate 1-decarboxylase